MEFTKTKKIEIDEKDFLQCVIDDIINNYLVDDIYRILDDYLADNVDDEITDDDDLYFDMKDRLAEYCENIIKAKLTLEKPEEESDEPEEPTENILVVDTGKRKIDVDTKKIANNIDDYFSEYTVNDWDWAEWVEVVNNELMDIGFTGDELCYLEETNQIEDIVANIRDSYPPLQ